MIEDTFETLEIAALDYANLLHKLSVHHPERPMNITKTELWVLEQAWSTMQQCKLDHYESQRKAQLK